MDDRSVSLNYYLSKEYRDPPKAFWKYYDLYRRKQITLDEYAVMTGLAPSAICRYLAAITEKKATCKIYRKKNLNGSTCDIFLCSNGRKE